MSAGGDLAPEEVGPRRAGAVWIGSPPLWCARIGTRMSSLRRTVPLTKRARLADEHDCSPVGIV